MTDLIKINCPGCRTKYSIPLDKFPKQGSIKLNCKKCGTSFSYTMSGEVKKSTGQNHGNIEENEEGNKTMIGSTFISGRCSGMESLPKDCKITLTYEIDNQEIEQVINRRFTIIGRTEGDIIIDDSLISRKHASIEIKSPTMVELRDLASTNGISHNGMKINSVYLQSGDEIKIGSTIIRFRSDINFV